MFLPHFKREFCEGKKEDYFNLVSDRFNVYERKVYSYSFIASGVLNVRELHFEKY